LEKDTLEATTSPDLEMNDEALEADITTFEDEPDAEDLDTLFEDDEDEVEPEAEAEAQPEAAAGAAAPSLGERLLKAVQGFDVDPEEYVRHLEQTASRPAAEVPVDDEVVTILQQDPVAVQLAQAIEADEFVTDAERATAVVAFRSLQSTVRQEVIGARREREHQAEQASRGLRDRIDQLSETAQFKRHLASAADRKALFDYAREKRIDDVEVAAKAFFFDRQFRDGRRTQEVARRRTVSAGVPSRALSTGQVPPPEVIEGGTASIFRWMKKHNPGGLRGR